jgi:hypothetical protein
VAAVTAAARDDAEAEVAAVERRAAAERACLEAEPEPPPIEAAEREARLGAARRGARERLAHEDWLDRRSALELREEWMARAAAEGRRHFALDRDALTRLAREAIARLPNATEVVVCVEEAPLLEGIALDARVVADPRSPRGSCLARTREGRLSFDNGLEARARRLVHEWRAALGEVFGP